MRSSSLVVRSALLLLLLATRGCAGVFRVVAPVLANDDPLRGAGADGIKHQLALFGRPTADGRSIAAPLVLAPLGDRKACSALNRTALDLALAQSGISTSSGAAAAVAARHVAGSQRHDTASVNDHGDATSESSTRAFVLMVERGECHFAEKARHAQQVGAAGAVIYNAESNDDDAELVTMANDALSDDVHIPSLLIHRRDAMQLMELMRIVPTTVVQLSWSELRSTDAPVEAALWFTSRSSSEVRSLVEALRMITRAFDEEDDEMQRLHRSVRFTPFYDVYEGSYWGCEAPSTTTPSPADTNNSIDARDSIASTSCDKLCIYDRKFCTYDPEWDPSTGLDGADVLEEDVRQLCVAQYARNATVDNSSSSALLWDYVAAFNRQCSVTNATRTNGFNAACAHGVLTSLSVPLDAIATCVREQGESLLAEQVTARHKRGVVTVPFFTVDDDNDTPQGHDDALVCPEPIALASCAPLRRVCSALARVAAETATATSTPAAAMPRACSAAFWDASDACIAPLERDDCGECNIREHTHLWNRKCVGCDGVPYSAKDLDECGVCGGDGSFDVCGRCLPQGDPMRNKSCADCKGMPNGASVRDACGVCEGRGSFDACGLCLDAHDPRRQSAHCRVVEDPDAVRGKVQIAGIRAMQFRGAMAAAFERAISVAANVSAANVLLKSVTDEDDSACSADRCVEVFFFVPCSDDATRASVTKRLRDPSASLTAAIAMRAYLDEVAYGLNEAASIEHVRVHSVASLSTWGGSGGAAAVSAMRAATDPSRDGDPASMSPSSSAVTVVLGALCLVTLVVGLVALRARDNRIRREFQQMFAAYTPLTSLDQEDERIASFP